MSKLARFLLLLASLCVAATVYAQDIGAALMAPAADTSVVDAHDLASKTIDAFDKGEYQLGAALLLTLFITLIRMGAVKLPGRLGQAMASKTGGALLSIAFGIAGAVATASYAGKPVNLHLILSGLLSAWLASGLHAHVKKMPKPKKAPPAVALALLSVFLALPSTGCGGGAELTAIKSLGFGSKGYSALQAGWLKYDRAQQESIDQQYVYRQDWLEATRLYRMRVQDPALKVLDSAGLFVVSLDTGIKAGQAGQKQNYPALVAAMWLGLGQAAVKLAELGVPGIPTLSQMQQGGAK